MTNTTPTLPAVAVPGRAAIDLAIWCPHCRRPHWHGGGSMDSPFGDGDGHRVAHCDDPGKPWFDKGYDLVEVSPDDPRVADLVRRLRRDHFLIGRPTP